MKAILFDFGGTIDTDGVHWSEKFCELYARFAPALAKRDVERAFVESERLLPAEPGLAQLTFEETLARQLRIQFGLLGLPAGGGLLEEAAAFCYADVRRTIGRARTVLAELEPRYKLGVVSNNTGNLPIICREFALEDLFSAVIDSALVGVRKPDPAIFALALEALKVPPAEASVVGDSYDRDIVPGKALGCATVWLKGRSWTVPPSTEAADRTIGRFDEIREIFLH
jgi:putative hydrolase of the HAD superfamily